jgi:phage FluMu gp28-like protein
MWAAAEPIISSNPDYLCRVASTHNGPNSLFNRWIRRGEYPVNSMSRSRAWEMSKEDPIFPLVITSLKTKRRITPAEAQAEAGDEREYLQNYENQPSSESGSLLTWDLITKAVRAPHFARDEQSWSPATVGRLYSLEGDLYVGQDVGRSRDVSVVVVIQKLGHIRRLVGLLRMKNMRLPAQNREMDSLMAVCGHKIRRITVDGTGLGTGIVDGLTETYGTGLILGINFSSTVPVTADVAASGRKAATMSVTEKMAIQLAGLFDDSLIEIIADKELEDSLHLPERVVSDNGKRVSIAAERSKSEDGTTEHADHFWALALAEHGHAEGGTGSFSAEDAGAVITGGNAVSGSLPWIANFTDTHLPYPPFAP